jgi:putative salt-induced outer membrane protein YdiY
MDLGQVKYIGRRPKPAIRIRGDVNAGLDVKRGNTDTDAAHLDATVVARTAKDRATFHGEYDREKAEGIDTANRWLTYLDYNRFLNKKLFAFGNATFESDEFRDLNLRSTLGAGLGYEVFDTPQRNLDVRGGLAYVDEDFDIGEDKTYPSFTWGFNYDEWLFDKITQFFHRHQGFISLGDPSKTVIRTRTGFRFPLPKGFSTTLQYNWDWDNNPAPGADPVDTRALVLIGYNF